MVKENDCSRDSFLIKHHEIQIVKTYWDWQYFQSPKVVTVDERLLLGATNNTSSSERREKGLMK